MTHASQAGRMFSRAIDANDGLDVVRRLRATLAQAGLDCTCRQVLDGAFERFETLESRRLSKRLLTEARDHKDRIAALLGLLSELDQVTEAENDGTVFEEMALLFEEIGLSAATGAAAVRGVGCPPAR